MGILASLNSEQKKSICLLQVGTVFEYFDLMLYVHMAVLLNDLFFPQTDPHTASLLTASAFCSTFVLRPIGALIFGWLGDNIGRKSTIILTTVIMSISCLLMASLPTYAQIGISAAWIMIFCRMAQGLSSMGEIIGAQIYVAESVRRPVSYPIVAFITLSASVGTILALGVASLVTSFYMNWRIAFWIGAIFAITGAVAGTRLRETPDFLEMKRQKLKEGFAGVVTRYLSEAGSQNPVENSPRNFITELSEWKRHVSPKTLASYFFISCGWPLSLYLVYLYFNPILKGIYGYSAADIIYHNLLLSIFFLIPTIAMAFLSYRIHPIRLLKIRSTLALLLMLSLPFLINNLHSPFQVFLLQALILLLPLDSIPGEAVLIYHLPIYSRFTLASILFALSRTTIYILTSFGLIYLGSYFGAFGLWFIILPVTLSYLYGIQHFEDLEQKAGYLSLNLGFKRYSENEIIIKDAL